MKKFFMMTAALILVAASIAEARPSRDPMPPRRPGPPAQEITLQPREWGLPFMAATAPDDAIINGRFPGNVYASQEAIRTRAQQICSYYGFGQMTDFGLGYANAQDYVTIGYGWTLDRAQSDLIRPFRDQYGRIAGYAQGFSYVRCMNR